MQGWQTTVGLTRDDLFKLNQVIMHWEDEIGSPERTANRAMGSALTKLYAVRDSLAIHLGMDEYRD